MFLACVTLLSVSALSEGIPELLRFTQKEVTNEINSFTNDLRVYPVTANREVNGDIRALVDEMADAYRPLLPVRRETEAKNILDTGAYIERTGTKWMSFLVISRVAADMEQLAAACDARVYDLETGRRVTMDDLFEADSAAWEMIADAIRAQLNIYYPDREADQDAVEALCSPDAIRNTPFTLSPARLSLHYASGELYKGTNTLMHVYVYYSALRPLMKAEAFEQTDNSAYELVALTYDDGPVRSNTDRLMNTLRRKGAGATFFVVGYYIYKSHDLLCREQDAVFDVQSHSYDHVYTGLTIDNILSNKSKMEQQLQAVTGKAPILMRPPGGVWKLYPAAHTAYPLILWSANSGDMADESKDDEQAIIDKALGLLKPGGVLLMHDMNRLSPSYSETIITSYENRGYYCVTIPELCDFYGWTLEPDAPFWGCAESAK